MSFRINRKIATRTFAWKWHNVTRESIEKHDDDNRIESESFKIRINSEATDWSFYACYDPLAGGLKFHLVRIDSSTTRFQVSFSLSIAHEFIRSDVNETPMRLFGWRDYIKLDELFNSDRSYIEENNCMNLIARVKLTELKQAPQVKERSPEEPLNTIESFHDFIDDRKYSDFTLVCSDKVPLFVHRIILAKKSQVFAVMFDTEMSEKVEKKANLGDINSKTMMPVIRWMYTGDLEAFDVKLATSVLYAAEKYQLFDLKCHCINELMRQVSKENVLDVLRTADMYGEEALEEKSLSIILL